MIIAYIKTFIIIKERIVTADRINDQTYFTKNMLIRNRH